MYKILKYEYAWVVIEFSSKKKVTEELVALCVMEKIALQVIYSDRQFAENIHLMPINEVL